MFLFSIPMIVIIFGVAVFFIMKNRVALALLILVPFIYVLLYLVSLPREVYDMELGTVSATHKGPLGHILCLSIYYLFLGAGILALDISKSIRTRRG